MILLLYFTRRPNVEHSTGALSSATGYRGGRLNAFLTLQRLGEPVDGTTSARSALQIGAVFCVQRNPVKVLRQKDQFSIPPRSMNCNQTRPFKAKRAETHITSTASCRSRMRSASQTAVVQICLGCTQLG